MIRFVLFASIVSCVFGGTIPRMGLVHMLDGRIVDGNDTTIEEFPHQVSLRYYGRHNCGGAIYNETVIVTAAHCVKGVKKEYLEVVAGATRVSKGGVHSKIAEMHIHEDYNNPQYSNDIALLILENPLPLGESIQPIPLQESNVEVEPKTKALVSGWGRLTEGGSLPDVLQYVDVLVVDFEECFDVYKKIGIQLTNGTICAGHKEGGRNVCHGDSGGPLIANGKLIGLVSGSRGCARPNFPTFFTKISHFHDWINSKIRN